MISNLPVQRMHINTRNTTNSNNNTDWSKADENQRKEVEKSLQAFIKESNHPCLSAQSVFNNAAITFEVYEQLGSKSAALGIEKQLNSFLKQKRKSKQRFASFIAVFKNPGALTEIKFEELLWKQLALLHHVDKTAWDETVSSNPEDPDFSFSFSGHAFYIIGLHPGSSRKARQFKYPALVFNLHAQFEELREQGQYTKMREAIRERDRKFQGSVNPMMEDHGLASEARQYSGRKVDENWKCPFHNHSK